MGTDAQVIMTSGSLDESDFLEPTVSTQACDESPEIRMADDTESSPWKEIDLKKIVIREYTLKK